MKINVRKSTMVRPAEEMPKRSLWVSNLDLQLRWVRTPYIYFYRSNGSPDFFNPNPIKEALGRALVSFYPIAGRQREGRDGRFEIECNGEGVLFVEAETTSVLDDLDDFASMDDEYESLLPTNGSYLCVIQLTYFKCGGVSLGVGMNHIVGDASSNAHFVNTWAEIARGLDPTIPPVHDRTLLRARDPPQPKFGYTQIQPPPRITTTDPPHHPQESTNRLFKITSDQINTLKARCKQAADETTTTTTTYTTNDVLSGHIWRCVCKARGLGGAKDEATSLLMVVDARSRLQPALPPGYFGNAVISAVDVAGANDLVVGPDWYAASRVHEVVARTKNNESVMSALDYLELQLPHLDALLPDPNSFRGRCLAISNWRWIPFYDSDFGWGRPVFVGVAGASFAGGAVILPCPVNDGSVSFTICLSVEHMKLFEMHLYNI